VEDAGDLRYQHGQPPLDGSTGPGFSGFHDDLPKSKSRGGNFHDDLERYRSNSGSSHDDLDQPGSRVVSPHLNDGAVTASAEAISLYQSYVSACVDMAAGAVAPSSSAIYLSEDRGRSELESDGASGLGFDAGCHGACPPPPQSRSLPAVAAAVPYSTSSAAGGLQRTARHVLGGTLKHVARTLTVSPSEEIAVEVSPTSSMSAAAGACGPRSDIGVEMDDDYVGFEWDAAAAAAVYAGFAAAGARRATVVGANPEVAREFAVWGTEG